MFVAAGLGIIAQALDHRIIMHDDQRLLAVDPRDLASHVISKIESAAFPIAGQVLCAALDRAIGTDFSRTTDANDRHQFELLLLRPFNEITQHADDPARSIVAFRLLVGMTPQVNF